MALVSSSKLEQAREQILDATAAAAGLALGGSRDPARDGRGVEALGKVCVGGQDADGNGARVAVKDGGTLDVVVGGTRKVVRGAAALAQGEVDGALALVVAGAEDLEKVKLAAVGPAAAAVVLRGARNRRVERPDGGQVAVEAAEAVHGHLEVEEKYLVRSLEPL